MLSNNSHYDSDWVDKLSLGQCRNPHQYLGLHEVPGGKIIRVWNPSATSIDITVGNEKIQLHKRDDRGLFETNVSGNWENKVYKICSDFGSYIDPYNYEPTIGPQDIYFFSKGVHYEIYEKLGAHRRRINGQDGFSFAVWAPNALGVSLVSDFNRWNVLSHPMRLISQVGIWEIFIPLDLEGQCYKFAIQTKDHQWLYKIDPYGFQFEFRPNNSSVVVSSGYDWSDQDWLKERKNTFSSPKPLVVYELHLASWKDHHDWRKIYRSFARPLALYCKEMGFTHIELIGAAEYPYDGSWGYQVTGYYAPTSRYGSLEDFKYFVDVLHQHNIGVFIDWVPGHFPMDEHALAYFDGTALYEHQDPKEGFHPHWFTHIFNYGRHEVSNFLIGSALYWIEQLHIDGFRVDAVASIIYRDYGRADGEWIPNKYGGKENLEAIEWIKHLNSIIHDKHPDIIMVAEESTAFKGVTHSLNEEGLGFNYKWNMGWMNDTLRYFQTDPLFRKYHHHYLTFGNTYAYSEKFLLILSHDEVVHGKKSLLDKMPGNGNWLDKFAQLRLLYSYLICQPGQKGWFMGSEIASWNEWDYQKPLEWSMLSWPTHMGIYQLVKDLNHLYLQHQAFWQKGHDPSSFEWVDFSDTNHSVIAYLRHADNETLLCVHQFTCANHQEYQLLVSKAEQLEEIFNSDSKKYFGLNRKNLNVLNPNKQGYFKLVLPPFSTIIFNVKLKK